MRKFIRHPSDMPVEVNLRDVVASDKEYLYNISTGGLCLSSRRKLTVNTPVVVSLPLLHPEFQTRAKVVWCREGAEGRYDVGLEFTEDTGVFKDRMIEQICYIEYYKKQALEKEGRVLTGEEAALEWLKQAFPEDDS